MSRCDERRRRLAEALQVNRMSIFVPAVMGLGLAFWVVSELRELVRDSRDDSRDRRATLAAEAVTAAVRGTSPDRGRGLRPRPLYLLLAVMMLGAGAYLSVGLYVRQQNELRGAGPGVSAEAWLLSVAVCLACVGALYGLTALVLFARWNRAPAWALGLAARSILTTRPVEEGAYPGRGSRAVTIGFTATTSASIVLAVVVGWLPWLVDGLDREIVGWLDGHDPLASVSWLDPLGSTHVAIAFALFVGLASMRCRVLAASYGAATALGLAWSAIVRPLVARERPPTGSLAGGFDSFPSGHVTLSVLFAGAMPLAVAVLLDRRWLVRPLRIVFGIGAAAAAIHRIVAGTHWPTDVIGGILIGLSLVFAVQWSVETERSHRLCHHCLWGHRQPGQSTHGALSLHLHHVHALRLAAHLAAAAVAVCLTVLTLTKGLPTEPNGFVFSEAVQRDVQMSLAGMVSVAALIAWKWEALGAVLLALAGAGLGVFAAVQYPPEVGLAVTGALLVPAILLWLAWQHHRRPVEIIGVAVATALLVSATWIAGGELYDANFGPTHPDSTAKLESVDEVEWVWQGALSSTEVTLSVRLADDVAEARAVVEDDGTGELFESAVSPPGEHRIVKLKVDGLTPGADYSFRIEADGEPDEGRGHGSFATPAEGPMSFTFAVATCARVGSNGAVFGAIRAADPLIYLQLGDLHYANIDSTDPEAYFDAFDRVLTSPGQSALYRQVPIAYVWDDHDYGPNDANATSPGRSAARHAYRTAVPHYSVPPGDAPVYQAFTIGRVRFVMTDTRSERTADTMLGAEQLAWLIDELRTSSSTHALVVWANPDPWIDAAVEGADSWGGYPAERQQIADAIADAGIRNLVMVSGDAHMVAIDDGTNSDYSTSQSGGFPVLHAAALDRPGLVKGGPYSEGAFPGSGQFGLVEVDDDGGDTIRVRLVGKRWTGEEIVSLALTLP